MRKIRALDELKMGSNKLESFNDPKTKKGQAGRGTEGKTGPYGTLGGHKNRPQTFIHIGNLAQEEK